MYLKLCKIHKAVVKPPYHKAGWSKQAYSYTYQHHQTASELLLSQEISPTIPSHFPEGTPKEIVPTTVPSKLS